MTSENVPTETPHVYPPSPIAVKYKERVNWIAHKGALDAPMDIASLSIQCDNMDKNIHHFCLNDKVIRRKNNLIISYNCITCQRENIIALNNLVSKIDRNIAHCTSCVATTHLPNFEKHMNASMRMKLEADAQAFLDMPKDIRDKYMDKTMKVEAFDILKKSIKGYQNMKFTNIEDIVYMPWCRCTSNMRSFEPIFYDTKRDTIEKPVHLTLECQHCAYQFVVKELHPYRNKKRILCKACEQEFGPTKPRHELNLNQEQVIHRTAFQHKLIKYCNKNGVIIQNGPKGVPFHHSDGTTRIANLHFALPECNVIVDVVGNLEFQKSPSAKTIALEHYATHQGLKYMILHPKNYVKVTRGWKKYVDRFKQQLTPMQHM